MDKTKLVWYLSLGATSLCSSCFAAQAYEKLITSVSAVPIRIVSGKDTTCSMTKPAGAAPGEGIRSGSSAIPARVESSDGAATRPMMVSSEVHRLPVLTLLTNPVETDLSDLSLADCIRRLNSPDHSTIIEAAEDARARDYALARPWLLQALARACSRQAVIIIADALAEIRTRELFPALVRFPQVKKEFSDRVGLPLLARVIFGHGTPLSTTIAEQPFRDWWSAHEESYWAEDFRDWSLPKAEQSPAMYAIPLGLLGPVFEPRAIFADGVTNTLYLSDFGKLARVDLSNPKETYKMRKPLDSALLNVSTGQRAVHSAFMAQELDNAVWLTFAEPWGLAVLDRDMHLLRYHATDKHAIEAEYQQLTASGRRFRRSAADVRSRWPIDNQGRIWDYVPKAGAIRTYDGQAWAPLDLRPAATKTPALLKRLGCSDDLIVGFQREYVHVCGIAQTSDGYIYLGTTEGILAYKDSKWKHLNALDNLLLGYSKLFLAGEGRPGEMWVSCKDQDHYGLVALKDGAVLHTFAGCWTALPGKPVLDRLGNTWFRQGFRSDAGPVVWDGAGWREFPQFPSKDPEPLGLVSDTRGAVWLWNEHVLARCTDGTMSFLTPPEPNIVGLVMDATATPWLVTARGLWSRGERRWEIRLRW